MFVYPTIIPQQVSQTCGKCPTWTAIGPWTQSPYVNADQYYTCVRPKKVWKCSHTCIGGGGGVDAGVTIDGQYYTQTTVCVAQCTAEDIITSLPTGTNVPYITSDLCNAGIKDYASAPNNMKTYATEPKGTFGLNMGKYCAWHPVSS